MTKSQQPTSRATAQTDQKNPKRPALSTFSVLYPQTTDRIDKVLVELLRTGQGNLQPDVPSLRESTRSLIQRLIENGAVHISGQVAHSKTRPEAGAAVELHFPQPETLDLVPEQMDFEILFEDEHLLVINKPQGLTVHPSETQKSGTLVHGLLSRTGTLSGIGGKLRPGIVHRLDKDTSGALLITKSDLAHVRMSEVFARHDLDRRYWALCFGSPRFPNGLNSGRLETKIGRHPTDRKRMSTEVRGGRTAVTEIRVLETFSGPRYPFATLVEAKLHTGRTHQVRVHLHSLGASVLGDPLYGTPTKRSDKLLTLPEKARQILTELPGQALHARLLAFRHPITGQELRFEAEPPLVFQKLLETLRVGK